MKATWKYDNCCGTKAGRIAVEVEASTLKEFAEKLLNAYAFELGDGYYTQTFIGIEDVKSTFGEDLPEWAADNQMWPVVALTSNGITEILCNPTAKDIVKQIRGEGYGDLNLTITGVDF